VPYVAVDGRGGVLLAMRHLLGLGHRRIALIMLPSDLATSEPHYQGYSAALTAAGIAVDPTLILETGRTQIDGVTAMQELLDLPEPPTAVLTCSDEVAFGAMHALHTAGREVGRDVSLVGFDDVPMAAHTHPPLTTLHYPQRDLGLHLARLLIGRIEGHTRNQQSVTLEMNLIIRKSTGPVSVGDQG